MKLIRVTRTGATAAPLVVNYQAGGVAAHPDDYTGLPNLSPLNTGTLTIPAGASHLDLTLTAVADALDEGDETLTLTLLPGPYVPPAFEPAYTVGANATAGAVIFDAPRVWLTADVDSTIENFPAAPGVFRLHRSGGDPDAPLTVALVASGTAAAGADYTTLPTTVTIPGGATGVDVPVVPVDDNQPEGDEAVTLAIAAGVYLVGAPALATVTIRDDDAPALPVVTVLATDPIAAEADAANTMTFRIARTGDPTAEMVVDYHTWGSTADPTADVAGLPNYDPAAHGGWVVIPAGEQWVDITLTPVDDFDLEGSEIVQLAALPRPGYVVGYPGRATAAVDDDEVLPEVTLEVLDNRAYENPAWDTAVFRFTRISGLPDAPLRVNYRVGGTAVRDDYTDPNGTTGLPNLGETGNTGWVEIPAGPGPNPADPYRRWVDVVVKAYDDDLVEELETVTLQLASGGGYTYQPADPVVATIVSDDLPPSPPPPPPGPPPLPVVRVNSPDVVMTEGTPTDIATLVVTRTGDLGVPLTVRYTISPAGYYIPYAGPDLDFTGLPNWPPMTGLGTIQFDVGVDTVSFDLTALDDLTYESTEWAKFSLVPVAGEYQVYPLAYSVDVAVVDNEPPPPPPVYVSVAAPDPLGIENSDDTITFRVTRTGPLNADIAVGYKIGGTADPKVDYDGLPGFDPVTGIGRVLLAAGKDVVEFTLTTLDDTIQEGDESVTVTLLPAPEFILWGSSAGATIRDDLDTPVVSLVALDGAGAEPDDTITFRVSRRGGDQSQPLDVGFTTWQYLPWYNLATPGVDYTGLPGYPTGLPVVTIPAGESAVDVVLKPVDDHAVEPTELVWLQLTGRPTYYLAPTEKVTATATLADNDPPPVVSIEFLDADAAENDPTDTLSFRVTRVGDLTDPFWVRLAVGGTATPNGSLWSDYTGLTSNWGVGWGVTIDAGAASAVVTLTTIDDAWVEGDETVHIGLVQGWGYVPASTTPVVGVIRDDDPSLPVVTVTAVDAAARTPERAVTITAERSPDDDAVRIAVENSGARIGDDVRAKLFRPFFTTKKPDEGTGLGLTISRRIVEGHGGTLVHDPTRDRTTFVVTLKTT